MAAIVRSEFALALNQIATERGIDVEVVIETIKAAILAAYRKDYGNKDISDIEVFINPKTGETSLIRNKKDITPPGFGRIATQTAKQVIMQRIREAEKKAILQDYANRVGTIVNGMVLRFDGSNIVVDIGKAEAVMPPPEQIPSEHYRLNQRLTFYIKDIKDTIRGSEITVSRSDPSLIKGLFKREVPEVANASVEIKKVAREPGNRSKIAVFSNQSGVDPVGSCVGQKGVRVQAVINEIGGLEKIDIIQWSEDPTLFIRSALAPASDIEIITNEKIKRATALVPNDQLSLAIGKDGQNVRLASKLTDWKIDIKPKSETSSKADSEKKKKQKKSNKAGSQQYEKEQKTVKSSKKEAENSKNESSNSKKITQPKEKIKKKKKSSSGRK